MRGGRVGIKASRSWRPVSASDDGGRRVEASKKIRESVPDCPPISAPHLLHASPVIARPRSAPAAQRPKRKRGVREGVTSRCPLSPLPLRASAGRASRGVLPGATPLTGDWNSPKAGRVYVDRTRRETKVGRHGKYRLEPDGCHPYRGMVRSPKATLSYFTVPPRAPLRRLSVRLRQVSH